MNKLDYIDIQNFEWVEENILSFELLPTDELLDIADKIREEKGFTDAATNPENDVWYNYYLDVNVVNETVTMWFTCNNGENDDYANYDIELSEKEKEHFIWKAFRQYAKEMDEQVYFV